MTLIGHIDQALAELRDPESTRQAAIVELEAARAILNASAGLVLDVILPSPDHKRLLTAAVEEEESR